jgi:hypothetical protein
MPAHLLTALLSAILRHIESVLPKLATGDPALAAEWDRLDLLRDQWVEVDLGSRSITGQACGIAPDGSLYMNDGQVVTRIFGGQVLRDGIPGGSAQVARACSPCPQYHGQVARASSPCPQYRGQDARATNAD